MSNVHEEADIVIVGAGTAGCVLAHRLSAQAGRSVVLLEAGGGDRHPMLRLPVGFVRLIRYPGWNWGLESEPEPGLGGRTLPLPRGRLLGGSSSINGMVHIRGHALDFDDWRDRHGCTGWGYADVLPYFRRSETHALGEGPYHGGSGPIQVRPIDTRALWAGPLRDAAVQAGHRLNDDYDGAVQDGLACATVAIDARGRRHSGARAYLAAARGRPNLSVRTRSQATQVVIERGRAVGVRYRQRGVERVVHARQEVVLAGGAYHSPQLLMLSGIGPADDLRRCGLAVHADLPGVGANLIEHPRLPLLFRARGDASFSRELRLDRAVRHALRWAIGAGGPFATQICNGTLLLRTDPALDRPDIQLLCNPVRLDAAMWLRPFTPAPEHGHYVTVCLLREHSRGRVSLRSADPAAPPRIALNLFADPRDRATLRAGLRAAREVYAQPPLASLLDGELTPGPEVQTDAQIDEAIARLGGITHHPVGTCAMGDGPAAVLDPQLRVRGIGGLRVADASVMPHIVGGNTNAATVMIGEKAADLILGRCLPPAALPDRIDGHAGRRSSEPTGATRPLDGRARQAGASA